MYQKHNGITSAVRENIPPTLICEIEDEYTIELKHAKLSRKIQYKNISKAENVQVDIPEIPHNFSQYCSDFLCEINGIEHPCDDPKNHNFTKIITIKANSTILKAGETLEIVIKCKWKNFINFLYDCYLSFSYSQNAVYKLTIKDFNVKERKYIILNDEKVIDENDIRITDDTIEFFQKEGKKISFGDGINLRLLVVNTPNSLTLLDSLYKKQDKVFNNYIIVLIQHLLGDFIHLLEKIEEYGATKESIFICGIPYSTKEATEEYIKLSGYPYILTPNEYPFTDEVRKIIRDVIKLAKSTNKEILVIEDGGYLFPLLYEEKEFEKDRGHFKFIVEQTANGIFNDEKTIKNNELKEYIPILNVANSDIKKEIEAKLIGKTVVSNIELLLAKEFIGIEGKKIGLVGFGSTGKNVVKNLVCRGASVKIFETKDVAKIEAEFTGGVQVVDSIMEVIKESDIIIESTGNPEPWASMNELSKFKNSSYFLSSSSKHLGINYNDLTEFTNKEINLPGIGKRYYLNNNNYITLLADGYPINFFIGESVPDKQIQFILVMLFGALFIGLKNIKKLDREIIDMNNKEDRFGFLELQNKVRKGFLYTKR